MLLFRLASRSLGFSRGGLDAPRLDRKLLYSRSWTLLPYIYPKGIAAFIHLKRALLPSYILKKHSCLHIFPKAMAAFIYFQRALLPLYISQLHEYNTMHWCLHLNSKGVAAFIYFQRPWLPSYIPKGHLLNIKFGINPPSAGSDPWRHSDQKLTRVMSQTLNSLAVPSLGTAHTYMQEFNNLKTNTNTMRVND